MVTLLVGFTALMAFIWFLSIRAVPLAGAYLGGYLVRQLGGHWITIGLGALLSASVVYGLFYWLTHLSQTRGWAGLLLRIIIGVPSFIIGFSFVREVMTMSENPTSGLEIAIIGVVAGLLTGGAALSACQRDKASMFSNYD